MTTSKDPLMTGAVGWLAGIPIVTNDRMPSDTIALISGKQIAVIRSSTLDRVQGLPWWRRWYRAMLRRVRRRWPR